MGAGAVFAAVVLAVGASAGASVTIPPAHPGPAPNAVAKERCRTIVKRVHGQKRRVRVCRKRKGAPRPAGTVVATIPLRAPGQSLAFGAGAVWVTVLGDRLLRIDPARNAVVAAIATPPAEWAPAVAVGEGSVWLSVPDPNSLVRIDPRTNAVVATIPVGHSPEGIAFAAGSVWTANHRSDAGDPRLGPSALTGTYSVSRVDPTTNTEIARVPVEVRSDSDPWERFCCGPQGMTAAAGAVWTGNAGRESIIRIDPVTNRAVATIQIPRGEACGGLTGDGASVWVAAGCSLPRVYRIDPVRNAVVAAVDVGAQAHEVALAGRNLWVTTRVGLVRIDRGANRVIGRLALPDEGGPLAIGDGSVWVVSGTRLLRIKPASR